MRVLAVTDTKRLEAYPDVPTIEELGYRPHRVTNWIGMYLPVGTPRPLAVRVGADIVKVINTNTVRDRLQTVSMNPVPMRMDEFSAFHLAEYQKWGEILKQLQIKLED